MNFQRGKHKDEPEINLIPMIDVLMVILIFLVVSTTYSKYTELQINLPQASAESAPHRANEINVAVDVAGNYAINDKTLPFGSTDNFAQALRQAAGSEPEPVIIINADANATHQSVINIMESARIAGYSKITFTTQSKPK